MKPFAAEGPSSYFCRRAAPPDEPFLLRLYASTRADELARTGWSDARREEFVRSQYQARRADYAANYGAAERSILYTAGGDIGSVIVHPTPAEIRLVDLAILPKYRNRGIGRQVIINLQRRAEAAGVPVRLSVAKTNRAQKLYRSLGFKLTGRAGAYLAMSWRHEA